MTSPDVDETAFLNLPEEHMKELMSLNYAEGAIEQIL